MLIVLTSSILLHLFVPIIPHYFLSTLFSALLSRLLHCTTSEVRIVLLLFHI